MSESAEERIFSEALLLPAAERSRFVENACGGDVALRRRVEDLIEAHESSASFMSAPVEGAPGAMPEASRHRGPEDRPGTRIGRYKLLQQIGEGGCGVVWMAEQEEPVRRRVALKVIKLGMDTASVISRFEAERQALALMDHPNIAKVFDAGATDAGRPYFVMELVPGVPITKYCDERNVSTRDRLKLFAQVCHAVQHAHQKGIIHRDLKPSNILVTIHDAEPVPKVIDFGIAKATQGRLTDRTLFTAFEQFIGTPAYMSPEQAEMSGIDVDTRSDIYSLGVLLYELLTGRPPFDPKTLVQAGLDEIRRIIREVDPPRPSTRLNTLADADRDTIARQRGTAPGQLSLVLRGDLDWIVMKALEKKRSRRYETANGLALDIQRHLQNEPVSARPPTTAYRISRAFRRHRTMFISTAAVLLALVAGTIVSTVQALRARRAERAAEAEQRKAETERGRAEDLLGFMIRDLRPQLAKVGRLDVLDAVGDKAMQYFSARAAEGLDDATLTRYAKVLSQIGEIRMDQARYAEALSAFTEAYERASALVSRHPRDGAMLFERGQAEFWIGYVHWKRGDFPTAADWLHRYHTTAKALVALDPGHAEWQSELAHAQHNLAVLDMEENRLDAARDAFTAELLTLVRLGADVSNREDLTFRLADTHGWLAAIAERQGRFEEGLAEYRHQQELLQQLKDSAPKAATWRYQFADCLVAQAAIEVVIGRLNEAAARVALAKPELEQLVKRDPANKSWHLALLHVRILEALLTWRASATDGLRHVETAREELEQMYAGEPTDRAIMHWLLRTLRLEAQLRPATNLDQARRTIARALEVGEKLTRGLRVKDADIGEYASALAVAGEIELRRPDAAAAVAHWRQGWTLLLPRLASTTDWRLLDPAVRLARRLGIDEGAQSAVAKLAATIYQPLEPWPEPGRAARPE